MLLQLGSKYLSFVDIPPLDGHDDYASGEQHGTYMLELIDALPDYFVELPHFGAKRLYLCELLALRTALETGGESETQHANHPGLTHLLDNTDADDIYALVDVVA